MTDLKELARSIFKEELKFVHKEEKRIILFFKGANVSGDGIGQFLKDAGLKSGNVHLDKWAGIITLEVDVDGT